MVIQVPSRYEFFSGTVRRSLLIFRRCRKNAEQAEDIFPQFKGRCDLAIEPLDLDKLAKLADVALCCLPHKVSMGFVPKLLDAGLKVVDFSADYRIKDTAVYEKYYAVKHTDEANLKKAVFGLPELFRKQIKGTKLIANPGCFPTTALLALAPVLKKKLIKTDSIIVNSVTGVSGAGKNPSVKFHFPNMNENLFAYGVGTHRHMPEMEQIASEVAGEKVEILFQPHAGPFDRGIFSTVYCEPKGKADAKELLESLQGFLRGRAICSGSRRHPRCKGRCVDELLPSFPDDVEGQDYNFLGHR